MSECALDCSDNDRYNNTLTCLGLLFIILVSAVSIIIIILVSKNNDYLQDDINNNLQDDINNNLQEKEVEDYDVDKASRSYIGKKPNKIYIEAIKALFGCSK